MLWKREAPKPAARAATLMSSNDSSPVSAEASLEALAEFLRSYGSGAFDLENRSAEQVQARCEAWARHLLVGVESPDFPAEGDDWKPGVDAPRDLLGLRRFIADTRAAEHSFISQNLNNMLEAIWSFISGMRHTLVFERQADEQVAHRLRRLESAARGNSTERLKQEALETVSMLRKCMADRGDHQWALIESLGVRLETMRAELSVVREQAACDGLTGLYNRASLDDHLERIVELRNRFGRESTLFMIDIDHFKWVNDTHGHPVGDVVLREVANCLKDCFSRTEDFVARFGGEEFVVVLQEGRAEITARLSERCLHRLRDLEFDIVAENLRISASLGISALHRRESAASWLERADQALYEAKSAGRDQVVVHADDRG
jgi:diguanylate cyclase (GGDEF)-like protein